MLEIERLIGEKESLRANSNLLMSKLRKKNSEYYKLKDSTRLTNSITSFNDNIENEEHNFSRGDDNR